MSKPAHSRILLKLSGEVLAGKQAYGIDPIKASNLANEIKSAHDMGTTIILVIGTYTAKGRDATAGNGRPQRATIAKNNKNNMLESSAAIRLESALRHGPAILKS